MIARKAKQVSVTCAATRLNNDALVKLLQGPILGKSRKALPHCNRRQQLSNTGQQFGSHFRYAKSDGANLAASAHASRDQAKQRQREWCGDPNKGHQVCLIDRALIAVVATGSIEAWEDVRPSP
jgi:hypothetical protein